MKEEAETAKIIQKKQQLIHIMKNFEEEIETFCRNTVHKMINALMCCLIMMPIVRMFNGLEYMINNKEKTIFPLAFVLVSIILKHLMERYKTFTKIVPCIFSMFGFIFLTEQ